MQMNRMHALVVAAAVTIASVMGVVEASARPGHGHGGPHGGGHYVSHSFGGHRAFHHGGPRFHRTYVSRGWHHSYRHHYYRPHRYYVGPRYSYRGCYRWRRVWTPYGSYLRRVNVCRRHYYYRHYW
jgi:hypothetical protein